MPLPWHMLSRLVGPIVINFIWKQMSPLKPKERLWLESPFKMKLYNRLLHRFYFLDCKYQIHTLRLFFLFEKVSHFSKDGQTLLDALLFHYCIFQTAKDSSVEKLIIKLKSWYLEKEGKFCIHPFSKCSCTIFFGTGLMSISTYIPVHVFKGWILPAICIISYWF
jgi:hypothetical protein